MIIVLMMSHCGQGNMALVYEKLGNFAAALQLETEVLKIRVSKLGAEHPQTLNHDLINLRTR